MLFLIIYCSSYKITPFHGLFSPGLKAILVKIPDGKMSFNQDSNAYLKLIVFWNKNFYVIFLLFFIKKIHIIKLNLHNSNGKEINMSNS